MKTGDSETISHLWQFAHLKHNFGHDRATRIIYPGNVQSIASRQNGLTANDLDLTTKRPPVGEVGSGSPSRAS